MFCPVLPGWETMGTLSGLRYKEICEIVGNLHSAPEKCVCDRESICERETERDRDRKKESEFDRERE